MQPGTVPEDINSILSRFHTWAETQQAGNGNGSAHRNGKPSESMTSPEDVREIPYEEAIRRHRSRRDAQSALPKSAGKKKAARQSVPVPPVAEATVPPEQKPPFVPSLELLAALRSAAAVPGARGVAPQAQVQPIVFREDTDPASEVHAASDAQRLATPSPAKAPPAKAALAAQPPVQPPVPRTPALSRKSTPAPASRELLTAEVAGEAVAPPTPGNPKAKLKRPRPREASPAAPRPATNRASGVAPGLPKFARTAQPMLHSTPAIPNKRARTAKTPPSVKAASPHAGRSRKPRHPPFHKVLTTTVQQHRIPDLPRKKGVPDRTRRITTRFTVAEERRIEKQASLLGLTVSAYLRHCVLATFTSPAESAPPSLGTGSRPKATPGGEQAPYTPNPYAAQGSSLIGGWLALLRNRFLGPPIQFSNDA